MKIDTVFLFDFNRATHERESQVKRSEIILTRFVNQIEFTLLFYVFFFSGLIPPQQSMTVGM